MSQEPTLKQKLYRIFDPEPGPGAETELYVNLDQVRGGLDTSGIVSRLADRIVLADTGNPTCQLLAGHRGSGKSTELLRLKTHIEEQHKMFVVYCKGKDDVDLNDADFPEVLVAIVRQMAAQLKNEADISLKPGYFKDRWERFKKVLGLKVSLDNVGLDVGLASLSAAVVASPDARRDLRQVMDPDAGSWLNAANDIIGEAKIELEKKGYQDLAILVDDLDKITDTVRPEADCTQAEYLFIKRHAQISGFNCHMVYTMPIATVYSPKEQSISSLYGGHPPVLPMTKTAERPPNCKPHPAGIKAFEKIVEKRLEKVGASNAEMFDSSEVQSKLIEMSGGQPSELMILIREAMVGGNLPISMIAVDRAVEVSRRAYARQLRDDHEPVLDEIHKTGNIKRTEKNAAPLRELLDSRAVLVYRNDDEWYAVNPVIPKPLKPK